MQPIFIRLFVLASLLYIPQSVFAQDYLSEFSQFSATSCDTAPKHYILGNFGGWKLSSNPRKKVEDINYIICFPSMLQCRNWLKYLETKYTVRAPYQEVCLRNQLK